MLVSVLPVPVCQFMLAVYMLPTNMAIQVQMHRWGSTRVPAGAVQEQKSEERVKPPLVHIDRNRKNHKKRCI